MRKKLRKTLAVITVITLIAAATLFTACGTSAESQISSTEQTSSGAQNVTITVFAAKSLHRVMEEIIQDYNRKNPDVTVICNYDSSGTLLTQIREGASCDVFFSASQSQMDELEREGTWLAVGTRQEVVKNQVCVVTARGSGTRVTGLSDIAEAASIALAAGSVPAGDYTRRAMIKSGMLESVEDAASIDTATISTALGGVEINECVNVGAVTAAVAEGANEVGTVYYSDTYGMEDKLEILEIISEELTGEVIYPVAQINNCDADTAQQEAAVDFIEFLLSDEAKEVFEKYYFDMK